MPKMGLILQGAAHWAHMSMALSPDLSNSDGSRSPSPECRSERLQQPQLRAHIMATFVPA